MFLRVAHTTCYDYDQPVTFAPHALYLRPRESARQKLHEFSLTITPEPRRLITADAEGNTLDWAQFPADAPTTHLEFRSEFMIETLDVNPFDFLLKSSAITYPFSYDETERQVLVPALTWMPGTDTAELQAWLAQHYPLPPADTVQYLIGLNHAVHVHLSYTRRDEPGIQTPSETLALRRGSCRDYAVLLMALCRWQGIAARFVSGYLHEPPSPDALDPLPPTTHAWVEVYLPGAGWRGLDPTRDKFCNDAYIPVAHSSVPESVNPIQGGFYGTSISTLSIHLRFTQL